MKQSPWEANSHSASQKILPLLWKPKVHYHVHNSLPLALFSARPIQSATSHPISLRSILILSSHPRLVLPSGLFCSSFSTKILYASPHSCYTPRQSHPPWLDHPNNTSRSVRSSQYTVFSSLPPRSSIFSSSCSHTPSVYVLFLVCETKFHTHKTTG